MAVALKDVRGMTADLLEKLKGEGVTGPATLLKAAGPAKERKELAKKLGLDARALLEVANRVDLSRIKGVAGAYSDLLEKAGVDTVPELGQRSAANLHKKMLEVNEAEKLTKNPPSAADVEDWVAQAKGLERAIHY